MSWRDANSGELTTGDVGRTVTLAGWVDRRRDHGGLVFVDLRDGSGVVQLVVNPEHAPAAAEAAHALRNEFVVQATGQVVARAPDLVNPNLPTGAIEVQVEQARHRFRVDAAAVPARRRERRRQRPHALPLARPAAPAAAAQHPPPRPDGRNDPPRHGGGGLRRHPDADPLEADTGGRARLPRARRGSSAARSTRCHSRRRSRSSCS